jgi:hypothetical protein
LPNSVPRLWPGSTVVCIGGGPSLTPDDVAYVRGKARVIAINNAYQLAPWGDVLWATDSTWWRQHKGVPSFQGLKFSAGISGAYDDCDVRLLKCKRGLKGMQGLSLDPDAIQHGKNGGHASINVAVHLGASRIVLLGYDCKLGPSGEEHWHKRHAYQPKLEFSLWLKNFETLIEPLKALNISIVNCTRDTALTCFPQMPLQEALPNVGVSQVA